jgi:acyl dehydratase
MSQTTPEFRLEPGYEFPPEEITVSEADQHQKHAFCDMPPERYGDVVDPTFLARRTILLNTDAIQACRPDCAPVHIVHRLKVHAPVRLGETVTMTGTYIAIPEISRGWVTKSRWEFHRADGTHVLTVEPDVMMMDPSKAPDGKKKGGRKERPADDEAGFETLLEKQCTPDTTLGYCEGTTNLIHTVPEVAKEYGFRAPIIAGNQTVNFLLEALALDGVPAEMDVELKFLKPVFWDDAVKVQGRRDGGVLTALRAVNGDGETVATGIVNSVRY